MKKMSGSSIRMKMILLLQGFQVLVDHCSEAGTVSKQESEGLIQVPRFFSMFLYSVFYLLQMLLYGLPELLAPGLWCGCL